MSARILAGSFVLVSVLVAICLFGYAFVSPTAERQPVQLGSKNDLAFDPR